MFSVMAMIIDARRTPHAARVPLLYTTMCPFPCVCLRTPFVVAKGVNLATVFFLHAVTFAVHLLIWT